MPTNFDFLKNSDRNLYQIISDAELLYRDEYFEQCMTQTRRFAENVCKKVLGDKRTTERTFDDMLATLKDNIKGSVEEHEFINDLYFLKKCGNEAVHSKSVKKDAINAMECLQRAFEVAINYSVYTLKDDKSNLKLHFDVKLLATGKKDRSLAKKYEQAEKQQKQDFKKTSKKTAIKKEIKRKKTLPQQSNMKSVKKKPRFSLYWKIVCGISIITVIMILTLLVIK